MGSFQQSGKNRLIIHLLKNKFKTRIENKLATG